jgi:hypothetical protein
MTTKAYLVSWLGKGNIKWTPLDQVNQSFNIPGIEQGPLRAALDMASTNSEKVASLQALIDPAMSKISSIQNTVQLTQNMMAIGLGLQVATIALTFKNYLMIKEVRRDVKEIKGKFELHFLDKSLDYFVDCHKDATGITPSVLYSLEKDLFVAIQELVENKITLPSYLQHKILVLTNTLRVWNEVIYSTIHDGKIHKLSVESIREWIQKKKTIANCSPNGGFTDQSLVLSEWELYMKDTEEDKSLFSSDKRILMERAISKTNFERTATVVELAREIQYSAELNNALADKLEKQEIPALILKAS